MTRYFLFLTVFLISISGIIAQTQPSCCQASSVKAFADLAGDISFVMAHEEPLPFVLQNPMGSTIKFPASDGTDAQGYYIAGKKSSKKWIFVFQEWWGLNDYIKNQSDQLHKEFPDAHILALDLYDGKVANTREEAGALMQGADPKRIEKIIEAGSAFSGKKSRIATIGWCFGGAWSNKASVMLGTKNRACIMYYGMPVKDEVQLKKIKAPVLGIFANKDGWITPKVVEEFAASMKKLGKSIETHGYEADHAFANPSNPRYHKEYSADAWNRSVQFIRKHL
jgi:carboxymethylenebutenolidase